jgi:hypothetical protein
MSTAINMTAQDLLDAIHIKYEQATDTPALTDDDGKIRMSLLNEGINRWETEDDTRWRELLVLNAVGPTIVAGTISYALTQTDFREFGSRIRFIKTDGTYFYVDITTVENLQRHINTVGYVNPTTGALQAAISGNRAVGYKLNLGWIPSATDATVGAIGYFDYYKWANRLVVVTDVPELSNPYFLIDFVTAELFVTDDVNLYTKFSSDASNKLDDMQTNNEAQPPYASSAIEDQNSNFAMG